MRTASAAAVFFLALAVFPKIVFALADDLGYRDNSFRARASAPDFPQPPANPAVMPVPKDKPAWFERHEAMNAKVKAGGIDLIYIGDSIVQFFETKGLDVWNRYYAPRKALNLGISGDRTQHVLWRLEHGNIDGISPKLAIVMIGQNNGGHNSAQQGQRLFL